MTETDDGLVIAPGTSVEKGVKLFEKFFGSVRAQKTPCDQSINLRDNSTKLDKKDTNSFRSIVGERPVLMFPIKKLACSMSSPTVQHLITSGSLLVS